MRSSESTVNERIREIINTFYNGNVTAFAKASFVSRTTLNSIIGTKEVNPGYEVIRNIGEISSPKINLRWLVSGKGDMAEITNDNVSLPLLPMSAMAGALSGVCTSVMEYDCERYSVPAFHGAEFLIRVQGDSMEPRYYSGDIIACKRVPLTDLWFQWGKAYVVDTRQGVLIKYVDEGAKENNITLRSDNHKYKPFQLPLAELNGVAIVVGMIRVE